MTADGRDGAANRRAASRLSRRSLLAALGGIGAVGAASGAGTFAYFSDAESFTRNEMGAGEVDIDVSCGHGTNCTVEGGHVAFAVDRIDRGDGGEETFTVDVRTNPARLWLGTDCPPAFDPLGDAIEASLGVWDENAWFTLSSGSLADIRRDLVAGRRLDDLNGDACFDPEGEPLEVVLDWSLPAAAPDGAAGKSTSFGFQLYAEQCRHVLEDAAAGSNPFAGAATCPDPCVICADETGAKIGSLALRYLGDETADVVATATGGGAGGVGQGGTVVFSGSVDSGETFLVDAAPIDVAGDDGNWLGPNLYVDEEGGTGSTGTEGPSNSGGGADRATGVKIHTSCSEPLEPGMVFGDFEVVSAATVDGELLCDSADEHDDEEHDEDEHDESEGNDPDCGVCSDGNGTRLRDLSFIYLGDADATIEISTRQTGPGSDPTVFGPETVESGETLLADGSDVSQKWDGDGSTGSLGPDTSLELTGGGDSGATTVVELHTSCSESVAVGDTLGSDGDGGPLYEIVAGTTTQGQLLCDPEDN